MITFTGTIKRFGQQGEKTGWQYLEIPAEVAEKIKPGFKKSYRVKGKLDDHSISQVSLLPMGSGSFIIPLNANIRKAIRKTTGASVRLQLTEDPRPVKICTELLICLADEPRAMENFKKLPLSHQNYYSKWIMSAKTDETKAKRIAKAVRALATNLSYGEMLRNS
jgi:hypothetical protein